MKQMLRDMKHTSFANMNVKLLIYWHNTISKRQNIYDTLNLL